MRRRCVAVEGPSRESIAYHRRDVWAGGMPSLTATAAPRHPHLRLAVPVACEDAHEVGADGDEGGLDEDDEHRGVPAAPDALVVRLPPQLVHQPLSARAHALSPVEPGGVAEAVGFEVPRGGRIVRGQECDDVFALRGEFQRCALGGISGAKPPEIM